MTKEQRSIRPSISWTIAAIDQDKTRRDRSATSRFVPALCRRSEIVFSSARVASAGEIERGGRGTVDRIDRDRGGSTGSGAVSDARSLSRVRSRVLDHRARDIFGCWRGRGYLSCRSRLLASPRGGWGVGGEKGTEERRWAAL